MNLQHTLTFLVVLATACSAGSAAGEALAVSDSSRALSLSGDDWRIVSFDPGQGMERRAFAEGYPAAEAIAATVPGDENRGQVILFSLLRVSSHAFADEGVAPETPPVSPRNSPHASGGPCRCSRE